MAAWAHVVASLNLFSANILYNGYLVYLWKICIDMRGVKVVHVHLKGKRRDLYFGSITAIYTVLNAEEVGASKDYLLHAGLSGGGTVVTKTAIIKQSTLITSRRDTNQEDNRQRRTEGK